MTTISQSAEIDVRHPSLREHRVPAAERERLLEAPGFGQVFTDHMVTLRWTAERGWHDARLEPYGPLTLDPATPVFHYAQEIFEGLKAYRQAGGPIAMFRPRANAARFNCVGAPDGHAGTARGRRSSGRSSCWSTQDRDWVPDAARAQPVPAPVHDRHAGRARHQPALAVVPVHCVIASPAAAYFPSGVKPVTVWLSEEYTRAAPGGTGAAKCGGNYAAAFAGQQQAVNNGCDQVVWLDAAEHRWVEEMGGMNLFFVYGSGPDARIMTPGADRDAAARGHPRLAADARPRPGHTGSRKARSRPTRGATAASPAS